MFPVRNNEIVLQNKLKQVFKMTKAFTSFAGFV